MRELMLRLLTYEPFEAISGDEKKYIDAVLAGNINFSQTFPLYDELMNALMYFCNQSGDTTKLVSWFNAFYSFSKAGNIGILCDQATGERTYYPVLFKKICFYCITEYNLRDADFLKQFGIKPNILNKWEISPRYRKLINRDSYHAINIRRNGKKQPYLTKVIKSAFYEASRQEAALRFFDPATKGWVAPKKEQLLPFIDVFAGSGCVAASVDANEMVVNDFDIGVACFLYSMSHDEKEVRTRLAELHNSFVSRDLSNGANHYTSDMWMEHKRKVRAYSKITDVAYDELMIRLRNNYEEIYIFFSPYAPEPLTPTTFFKYIYFQYPALLKRENTALAYMEQIDTLFPDIASDNFYMEFNDYPTSRWFTTFFNNKDCRIVIKKIDHYKNHLNIHLLLLPNTRRNYKLAHEQYEELKDNLSSYFNNNLHLHIRTTLLTMITGTRPRRKK